MPAGINKLNADMLEKKREKYRKRQRTEAKRKV